MPGCSKPYSWRSSSRSAPGDSSPSKTLRSFPNSKSCNEQPGGHGSGPLTIVQPETVIVRHRVGWRLYWRRKSRRRRPGRGVGQPADDPGLPARHGASVCDPRPRQHLQREGVATIRALGIEEKIISCQSPWQNRYVELALGSTQRECLDHVVVFGEQHLRRMRRGDIAYYHESRTHLRLRKDTPEPRAIQPR